MTKKANNIGRYYVLPEIIMFNKNLSQGAKLLYSLVQNLSNQKGYCFATNRYLSQGLNKSTSQIKRYLKELRRLNLIKDKLVYKNKEIVGRHIYINEDSSMNLTESIEAITPQSTDEPYNNQSSNTQIKEKEKGEKKYTISKEYFEREILKYQSVQSLPVPLTHISLSTIKDEYPDADLNHYLDRMENHPNLLRNNTDAAKTLRIWIQRDINKNQLVTRRK